MAMAGVNSEILLEAGTNELEVLVFRVGKLNCGVNVAKVREVIGDYKLTHVPNSHPAVVGVCKLRGSVLPLVDLEGYFNGGQRSDLSGKRNVIITEFNDMTMGFIVDGVERIYRLPWEQILPLPAHLASVDTAITSVCKVAENNIAMMVDFEKIAFDIQGIDVAAQRIERPRNGVKREAVRILLAEDSQMMRSFMVETLQQAGYEQVTAVENGALAWEQLEATAAGTTEPFHVLVSDLEMPQMDGLTLCRKTKEHRDLGQTPVVVFSSLVSSDNVNKLEQVGADAALTKPQLNQLVAIVDRLVAKAAEEIPEALPA
jgi:two-component system chemotaxis response regulator CheV